MDIQNVDKLEKLLQNAILSQIPANQKVGLYYSGGIDSSLIATFFDFEKITYQDGDYEKEFKEKFPQIIKVIGQPIKSFSPFAWWKCGEMAKQRGIKTVFSGESADELFGGYVRWIPESLNIQAQKKFPSYKSMFPAARDVNEVGMEAYYGDLQFLIDAEKKIAAYHGLNIIFPFADPKIVEFAWSLKPEDKIDGFETKVLLRRLLERRNPNYKHIEKHGLYCSVNKWIGAENEGFNKKSYLRLQYEILKT